MSITGNIKRLLYRHLSLENYLRVVSWGFFAGLRLGLGKNSPAYEYPHFLKNLVRRGDIAIDIGANLGYYSRILSRIVGEGGDNGEGEGNGHEGGKVYAVEPVKPILGVLRHNLRRCHNVGIVPFALGREYKPVLMVNDSARLAGYMGTGRNYIPETDDRERTVPDMEFEVEMRRGSELFAGLARLDFLKCDIEGYETVVIPEMAPVIERHLPIVLIETGGANRRPMIELFRRWGYAGYVLHDGRLTSVMRPPDEHSDKDIVFIPGHRHAELKHLIAQ
jgi:FkbM family methyltransferase